MPDAPSGLFPGHKHVDCFLEALEEDYDEETTYVTLDFGTIDPSVMAGAQFYALIGLDTNTPMLQLGSVVFEGTYENLLGSELLLSDGPSGERRKPTLSPFGITSGRRIRFREVQLEKKKETNVSSHGLRKSRQEDKSHSLSDEAEAQPGPSKFQRDNSAPETSRRNARRKGIRSRKK